MLLWFSIRYICANWCSVHLSRPVCSVGWVIFAGAYSGTYVFVQYPQSQHVVYNAPLLSYSFWKRLHKQFWIQPVRPIPRTRCLVIRHWYGFSSDLLTLLPSTKLRSTSGKVYCYFLTLSSIDSDIINMSPPW